MANFKSTLLGSAVGAFNGPSPGVSNSGAGVSRASTNEISFTFKMPNVDLAKNERGLIISSPITIAGDGVTFHEMYVDPQELRLALLFWDRLDWPNNNFVHIEGAGDAEPLIDAGVLTRSEALFSGGGSGGEIIRQVFVSTFRERDRRQPGHWSLARGDRFLSFHDADLDIGRGILFDLYAALPVPDREVPYADVLEFKQKHFAELLALRVHLEDVYQAVQDSPDRDLSALSAIGRLDLAVKDLLGAAKSSRLPFRAADLSVSIDLKDFVIGSLVSQKAMSSGLDATTSLLSGIAGASVSASLSFSIGSGLKRRTPSTPFQYVSRVHQRLF
ncbi:MAG: DUF6236 family protein [Hyphomonas sp.]|nr:DUF6236 family protein [Hyphomonas sp.]